MALRVLLADESTTIKKVIQLTLQDFAVDVKAVHVGVDVLDVARSFEPEIIFVDVLLQKKTGYDVVRELKNDAKLKNVPVILMWSSFMELDDKLATECGADARLEKPFDAETLRQIVLQKVPKTHSQRLAHFLQFPPTIAEGLKKEEALKQATNAKGTPVTQDSQLKSPPPPPPVPSFEIPSTNPKIPVTVDLEIDLHDSPAAPRAPTRIAKEIPQPPPASSGTRVTRVIDDGEGDPISSWDMDSFDDVENFADKKEAGEEAEPFQELNLTGMTTTSSKRTKAPPAIEAWSHQDLSKFKLDIPNDGSHEGLVIDEEAGNEIEVPSEPTAENEDSEADQFRQTSRVSLGNIGRPFDNDENEIPMPIEPLEEEPSLVTDTEELDTVARLELEQQPIQQISAEHLEAIIRAQSREVIESVVRRIVPELATEMIRAEIARLMGEQDSEL
jgi:CheY-like chemotaxis protein